MPIYEFKCLDCEDFFELLVMGSNENTEMKCPKCKSENFERVISATNYSMGESSGKSSSVKTQSRTCSSGSCTTWTLPGHGS